MPIETHPIRGNTQMIMRKGRPWAFCLAFAVMLGGLTGCVRDPNIRKQTFLKSGNEYFAQEKYREAAIQYLNAIKLDPQFVEGHYQLAQTYLRLQIWSGAYQELLRTVDLKPDHWKAHIDLGNLFLSARRFADAQQRAQIVLEKDPQNVDAHVLLANSYAALQNMQASIQEMETAIQLDPDRSKSYLNMGLLQLGAQQAAAAETSFKKAIELEPNSVQAVLALANYYQMLRRAPEAEPLLRRAIQIEPRSPSTHAALARFLASQDRRDEAEQALILAKAAMSDVPAGYRLLGDFYFLTGKSEKAVAEYASIVQQHPDDLRAKKNYAQLLIGLNRLDQAEQVVSDIQKANPRDVEGQILRAQMLIIRKKYQEAVSTLEAAVKTEGDNAFLHFHLGRALAAAGNTARAETEWRDALRLAPAMVSANEALAGVAAQKGDWDQMHRAAESILLNSPNAPSGYLLRAGARIGRGDLAGGEADLKRASELAPRNPAPHIQLGAMRASVKRYADAERHFERALELDPRNAVGLQALVGLHFEQKQNSKAVARAVAQVEKEPSASPLHFVLGSAFFATGETEKAEEALLKAIEIDKGNAQAWVLLAQVQASYEGLDKAAASFARALEADPRQPLVYVLYGSLEEKRNNWRHAQELYERSLQVKPDFPLAANNLAYLMLEKGGNVDAALSHAQVARRGLPDLPNTADTLAWAYYHKGAYTSAIGLLQEAIKKSPDNAVYHYHLGMAYWKVNDPTAAKRHLSRALRLNPKIEKAEEIEQVISQLE